MNNKLTLPAFQRDGLIKKLRGRLPAVIVIGLTVLLAVFIGVRSGAPQVVNAIVTGGMWALLAAGLALVFGVMNIPSFAHGESFMVGAFVGYYVFTPLGNYLRDHPNALLAFLAPFLAFAVAALAGFVLGALIERLVVAPLRKRTREGWVMNTFLLTAGISFILINGTNLTLGPNFRGIPNYFDFKPLEFLGMRISMDRVIAFIIAILTIVALSWYMQRTRTGQAIRAVSQDETGAEMVGINLSYIHTLTFALATAMAALAGAALLFMFQAYPTVGLKPNYFAWYVVMLVGLGNVPGAIIGGFIVSLLQAATQVFIGIEWEDVVPTVVMILILVVVPSGIFGSEVKGIHEL